MQSPKKCIFQHPSGAQTLEMFPEVNAKQIFLTMIFLIKSHIRMFSSTYPCPCISCTYCILYLTSRGMHDIFQSVLYTALEWHLRSNTNEVPPLYLNLHQSSCDIQSSFSLLICHIFLSTLVRPMLAFHVQLFFFLLPQYPVVPFCVPNRATHV